MIPPNRERLGFLRLCRSLDLLTATTSAELDELEAAAVNYERQQVARLRFGQYGNFKASRATAPEFCRGPSVIIHAGGHDVSAR